MTVFEEASASALLDHSATTAVGVAIPLPAYLTDNL